MNNPKISVVMATYNHEPFVTETIESVLSQDFDDYEFLISDDGSTDGTRNVVRAFKDSRITFLENEINRGAGVVTNALIEQARGKYIALINSDDVWLEGKLKYQFELLEKKPDIAACFGKASFCGRNGEHIIKQSLSFGSVFDKKNRSRGMWLRYFFDFGNCICHPTMLIHRRCYNVLGLYNNRLRQLPDFDMWVRLIKKYDIFVSDKDLIKFRILSGENASGNTYENSVRGINEYFLIANTFFDDVERETLIEGFQDVLVCKDIPSPEHLDIEKAMLYFIPNQWLGEPYVLIGLQKLYGLLTSSRHRELLKDVYKIDDLWFHNKMGAVNTLRRKQDYTLASTGIFQRIKAIIKARMG